MLASFKQYTWMIILYVSMVSCFIVNWGIYDSEIQKTIYLIAPLTTIFSGYYALRKVGLKGSRSKTLQRIEVGMILWFLGEIAFLYLDIFNLEPSPSWADFFFLSAYPILLSGVIIEKHTFQLNLNDLGLRLKLLLTTLSALVISIVIYLGYFVAFDPGASFLINVIGISWSLGDLVVGIALIYMVAMVWEFRNGLVKKTWSAFLLWGIVNLIADTVYGIFPEKAFDGSPLSIFLDSFWIAGYFFLAYYFLETRNQIVNLAKKFLPKE